MRGEISLTGVEEASAAAWLQAAIETRLAQIRDIMENPPQVRSEQVLSALIGESLTASQILWRFLQGGGDVHDLATAAEGPAIFGCIKRGQRAGVTALVRHLGLPVVLAFRNPAGESPLEALKAAMAEAEAEDLPALEAIDRCLNDGDCC
jgi:hypothetical protein